MESDGMGMLFENLPSFHVPLSQEALRFLSSLPLYPTVVEIDETKESICLILKKHNLVKIQRHKKDPISIRPTLYAGRLPL